MFISNQKHWPTVQSKLLNDNLSAHFDKCNSIRSNFYSNRDSVKSSFLKKFFSLFTSPLEYMCQIDHCSFNPSKTEVKKKISRY